MKSEVKRSLSFVLVCILAITMVFTVHLKEVNADEPETLQWTFNDVQNEDGNWIFEAVKYVYARNIMSGMSADTFGPTKNLARAQFAVVLYRMNGSPSVQYTPKFPDVPEGTWYTDAVLWANQCDIVGGYKNGLFGTSDDITREQMLVMMYRYANYMGYDTTRAADISGYPDVASVSNWAYPALQWAVGNNIISGDGGKLNPQGTVNRVVCATIIMNFLKQYNPNMPAKTIVYPQPVDPTPTTPPTPTIEPTPTPSPEVTTSYVANKNSKKFHKSNCGSVSRMKEENKWYVEAGISRDDLIAMGYVPCENCKP